MLLHLVGCLRRSGDIFHSEVTFKERTNCARITFKNHKQQSGAYLRDCTWETA